MIYRSIYIYICCKWNRYFSSLEKGFCQIMTVEDKLLRQQLSFHFHPAVPQFWRGRTNTSNIGFVKKRHHTAQTSLKTTERSFILVFEFRNLSKQAQ